MSWIKALCILVFFISGSCQKNTEQKSFVNTPIVHITGETMGTYYSVKINSKNIDKVKIKKLIEQKLKKINDIFSTYIPQSEISRINKLEAGVEFQVSEQMKNVLEVSEDLFKKSDGAFDPTVAPIVNRWGFGPVKKQGRPTDSQISTIMQSIGMNKYNLLNNKLVKQISELEIDLSAIAKGHGVDTIIDLLKSHGYKNILVEIGGEVRALGKKNQTTWAIGIEKPTALLGGGIQKIVPLINKSIATSGSYRNYQKYGDEVFSHTIDPKSGYPVKHKLISVSVIASKCLIADGWATALMVLGPEKGLKYANKEGLLAYFLVKTDKGIHEIMTNPFSSYLEGLKR